MKKALVIGVGPLNGLGAQLCKKIAKIQRRKLKAKRRRKTKKQNQ